MPDVAFPGSVAGALARRAARTPDRTAYLFLADGEEEQDRLTYAALDARARAIAAALLRSVEPGDRALLLYPPGLDFLAAFFGCLYAGVIAVPAYPPRSPRMMPRLLSILTDARPAVALAAGASQQRVSGWLERTPEAAALSWLATDELDPAPAGWEPPAPGGDAVAFLQYTSGSTSTPKGVMVTQANLVHNQRVIEAACGHSEESVFVSWLPPYHDLGLIGNLLQATWVGAPCVLMAPVAFLQKPSRWLQAVSRYRGTTSGGPNFAYDLCARRMSPAEIAALDLSSWQVAFNGAEPVREETLARFAAAFAPAGLPPGALYPCYGLAEATLMVSGGRPGEATVMGEVGGRRLVGCGRALLDLEVEIVDPGTANPCPPGEVGEIWVAGDSVARGYWNRPEETAEAFGARLADGRGPWLRTGDLGALLAGELFVAGRLKDLIILRGRNHYPQDLEATAGKAHPALGDGTGAAFAVDADGEERLVIVHEVERHAAGMDEIAAAVRQAVAQEHEALVYEVVLVPPGGVPRTTSGKVQRRGCRDLYLRDELRALGASRLSPAAADEDPETEAVPGSLDWLLRAFAAAARVAPGQVDPDRPLSASGLDSLAAVELRQTVEEATGVSLFLPDLLEGMTLREIEQRISGATPTSRWATEQLATGEATGAHPLSWNQRSLWFLYRLAPESPAYNIAGAARVHGVGAEALGRALQALVDRHPMLRATFADTADGPVQRVAERAEAALTIVDAAGWSDVEVRARLQAEAFRPFDLSAAPLLRAALVERGGEAFLSLAVHHIAADFWSMTVLAKELGALAAFEAPPPPAGHYTDFARRQEQLLQSPEGERLWEHWRERLAGTPQLDLPTDRPRRPVQTLRGGSRAVPPTAERAEAVRRIASTHGATPFVALLAAWQTVLSRWSGQEEFLTGAPMAGRSAREWRDVVGYFVNPVALSADLTGDPTVRDLVARTRATAVDALAHQDLPFALLAERLQPERDPSRPPLVAAMLTFEKAPEPELAGLAAFAVAVPGARLDLSGLGLESFPLDPPAAQLDLSLLAAELPEGVALFLQWDADLFDETTVSRMLGHLDRGLAGMAEAPERRAGEIDLLTPAERAQLVEGTATAYPREATIHALFAEQAARTPERVAVAADGGLALTYAELDARANQLAHYLKAAGVGPETPVGIALERSPEMLVATLGVLKAGGAYVPLDPGYPPERLARMQEEVRLPLVVTEALLARDREAIARQSAAHPGGWSDPSGLAYVMFTSGSTGRPKGVGVPHRAVVRLVRDTGYADLGPDQVFLQLAPASFDAATLEIWGPLLNGGRLALFPPGPPTPAALGAAIARHGVSTLWLTAGLFHEVADGGLAALRPLRQLLAGGDALSPESVNRVLAELPGCAMINGYGPTENTTFTCCHTVREPVGPGESVPIGRPIANTRVYVVDARLARVPPGVPGELVTGGDGLARGYLGRPDLTAERFVPSPFEPGERLYRTGDRVRLKPDGALEFLGRLDQQVKIRGFRVEPGEVEAALAELPGVAGAAVLVAGAGAGKRLVAFVVGEPGPLREALRDRLPSFMVPSRFVAVDSLPLSPNGKVDRRALAELLRALPDDSAGKDFDPPRGPVEERLAGIWRALLERGEVSRGDDFFALGGHSLLAVRLATRVRDAFGVELPLARIFGRTTLAEMAAEVERGAAGEAPPLAPGPRPAEIPLSFAQERLWFLDRLAPGQAVYNVPVALRLRGPLDAGALEAALTRLVERHEALRTVFAEGSAGPVQVILPPAPFPLERIDRPETEARREAEEEARRPFDLKTGPVIRGLLLQIAPEDHLLVLTIHHIAADGWSLDVLFRELEGGPARPLPVQYADYALWQRKWMTDEVLERRIAWWREALAGAPEALDLPADRPRPALPSWRGTALPFALPAPVVASLRETARHEDATLFMALLSGFAALLSRLSDQQDVVVGTVSASRDRAELEGLVGFFVNALPLRLGLAGGPGFSALLGRARETALGAFAHGDVPFERLVEALAPRRDRARPPLFQVSLAFQETPARPPRLPGVSAELEPIHTGTSRFDLNLFLEEDGEGGLSGGAEANADLFEATTVARMLGHLAALLEGAAADPGRPLEDLPLLSPAERRQVVLLWNEPVHEVPAGAAEETLHARFAAAAARAPEAVAVTGDGRQLTYAELENAANRLARRLRRLGVGPEVRVALYLERSPELVVALLGILKAGGAYVPLDPDVPGERLAYVLEDARPRAVVTQGALAARLPEDGPEIVRIDDPELKSEESGAPADVSLAGHAAYVIYTSGSTGRPKGVVVEHGQASRLLAATDAWFGFSSQDVWTLFHSIAFDFSVWEVWGALAYGGRLVVVPYWSSRSPARFYELLAEEKVTVVNQTPSAFRQLLRAEGERPAPLPLSLRWVIFGGEALEPAALAPWFDRHGDEEPRLVNMYGITETTVHVTFRPLSRADLAGPGLLGRPIPDLQVHLLDRRGEPVPLLVPGEIHVGGAGVARGYLERPALTSQRFVPDPFSGRSGARLYRSGDLARRLPGGEIEYLGRTDHQVKVRGFRIELGEIEAAISSHPAVAEAAVLVRGTGEEARLVAWVAPKRATAAELRRHLKDRLSEPMIPAAFVFLDALPLTANGKLDRRALPEPAAVSAPEADAEAPRTPAEEVVAGIWAELLGRDQVGRGDDFFELGGHSLLAARLVSRLRAALGVEIPLETVFQEPTVAALAAAVEAASRVPAPPLVPRPAGTRAPLSPAQERLWFLDRLEPGNPAYNVPLALHLSGPLNAAALETALVAVAARHEVLRSTFAELSGQPAVEISPEARFPLALVDLTGLTGEAERLATLEARQPFDLAAGPLGRAVLLRLGPEEHLLAVDLHHIAFDGSSVEILLRELGLLYAGEPLPPLPIQYGDFALWQRAWLDGGTLETQLAAWRERLAGAPTALDLPTDRRRPAVQTFRGGAEKAALPPELVRGLRALGRSRGATLFMTVLAGWAALLHRSSGAAEVMVGSPVANRRRPELEGLIGLFVNTLPLRVDLAGDPPFAELVDRVRATALAAYANQDVPFERLVEAVETGRDLSRSPLFQAMLALADGAAPALRLPGVAAREVPLHNGTAKFELLLALNARDGGLAGGLEFNADLFDTATARLLADRLSRLLAGAMADPETRVGDLPLLDAAEERQILAEWNATEAPFPRDLGLHELFLAQAARTPQATALIHGEERVTYAELAAWAGRLAGRLAALGVGPEVRVGVFCARAPAMVAAALGVLAAGGAYVPLDPAYPADRLAWLLSDSGVPVVLTEESVAGALPAFSGTLVRVDRGSGPEAEVRPRGFVHPEQAAYAIYTSGSTGAPKGVIVRHGSAVNRIAWALKAYPPDVLAGVLAATSLCFDLSVFEIFVPLAAGGAVILADDALALPDLPAASSVTLVNTVPSAISELARAGAIPASVRVVNLAGEPLRRDLAARLYAFPGIAEVHDLYGPSEDTTYSTGALVEREDEREPAIGRPLPNTRAYVLDAGFRPVPAGAPGELWIGGAGLARGYLGRPDLTADRFRPDPFGPAPGGRLYRTGDLTRQRADGTLDYLGRLDHQVKVRGFRIELGEIEAALLAHPEVREAAVLALPDGDGKRLVACVAPETAPPGELRRHLAERLPGFMVPAAYLLLPELPLTPNGKVDRRALERLAPGAARDGGGEYVAPRNAIEEILAPLWAEILGVERVSVQDDFFALGGSSLAGVRLVSRVRELFGVRLPVRQLFLAPTLAGMAEVLAAEMGALAGDDLLDEIDAEVLHG